MNKSEKLHLFGAAVSSHLFFLCPLGVTATGVVPALMSGKYLQVVVVTAN